jgi:hypothetical protein
MSGFGAMWFRRLIPTFQRNMPSPHSGLGWEEEDYIGFEEGRVRERVNQNLAN